jgi:hypothetical protein
MMPTWLAAAASVLVSASVGLEISRWTGPTYLGSAMCLDPQTVREREAEWITSRSVRAALALARHYGMCSPLLHRKPELRARELTWERRAAIGTLPRSGRDAYRNYTGVSVLLSAPADRWEAKYWAEITKARRVRRGTPPICTVDRDRSRPPEDS